jgi:hypothetical protein
VKRTEKQAIPLAIRKDILRVVIGERLRIRARGSVLRLLHSLFDNEFD